MQQPWVNSYPSDVPTVIGPDAYPSLVALLAEICTPFSTKRAFGSFGTYLTYAALDRQAEAFAAYLQRRLHVPPGDRVALMLPNLLQYPVALLGVLRCGGEYEPALYRARIKAPAERCSSKGYRYLRTHARRARRSARDDFAEGDCHPRGG